MLDIFQTHRTFVGSASDLSSRAVDCAKHFGSAVDPEKTNERLVRYYVTEGVLDRPDRKGRKTTYNFRHLLQLLSARRMVESGASLSVIAEYNRATTTAELEGGLTEPIPTDAQILINSFSSPSAQKRYFSKSRSGVSPPPMAIPDVLAEIKRMKDDWMQEISFVKRLRHDFEELRHVLTEHRALVDRTQHDFRVTLERTAAVSRDRELELMKQVTHMVEKHTDEVNQTSGEIREVFIGAQNLMAMQLADIQRRQEHLIDIVESLQEQAPAKDELEDSTLNLTTANTNQEKQEDNHTTDALDRKVTL
jgi:hypothetical protein